MVGAAAGIPVLTGSTPVEPVLLPDGTRVGHARVLCSAPIWAGLWECEPTSWTASFDADETIFVVHGAMSLDSVRLAPGEAGFFAKGTTGTMTVEQGFRAWVVVS